MEKAEPERENQEAAAGECDLDNGYVSAVRTYRDLSRENVTSAITGSRYLQILIFITAAGLFLRFYHLGFNSLWLDETVTWSISSGTIPQIWETVATGITDNPPLFYWTEHFMLQLGSSEGILRFMPALIGVVTIPLFYLLGKEFYDRNVGIIVAAGCAFSPYLIYYAQEARAYTLMLFFIGLAMLFFFRTFRSGSAKNWVLFGVFSALAVWSHYFALLMIAVLMLFLLGTCACRSRTEPAALKMLFVGGAVFIVLSLPVLYTGYALLSKTAASPSMETQGFALVRTVFQQFSGSEPFFLAGLVILFLFGVVQAFLSDRRKGIFLAFVIVLTFMITYFLSGKRPLDARYLIFLIIVFFLGIAVSYRAVYRFWNSRAVVYLFIAGFVLISVPALTHYYSAYSKPDWRGFSGSLAETVQPGDLVVSVPGYTSVTLSYYYPFRTAQTVQYPATTAEQLQKVVSLRENRTVYFIVQPGHLGFANPDGSTLAWIRHNARFTENDITNHISLYVSP